VSGRLDALQTRLRAPVDGASLAFFRIAFGLIALVEVYRYVSKGWVSRYWVDPTFHFTYTGFGWVRPPPEGVMFILWGLLAVAAVGITLGAFYRISCVTFALIFGYCFLIEAARYLNHFYLIALLAALLAIVPAHRVWSVDSWSRRRPPGGSVPTWSLWLLRFQIAVVYVYGGIAKIEPDWLRGEPMTTWLGRQGDLPLVGSLLTADGAGIAAAWAGLFFDLFIVAAVAWRRTRVVALVFAAAFHLINNELFSLGIFPYLAFAALLLFCDPAWPRTTWYRLGGRPPTPMAPAEATTPRRFLAPVALGIAAVYVVAQLLVPFRHLPEPGRSNWTEAGHTFAWHMKLRIKTGTVSFRVVDPARDDMTTVDPTDVLSSWQYSKMAIRPEMIRQFAHHLADLSAENGVPGVEVYAWTQASLNGRPTQQLVDPRVDLAAEPVSFGAPDWVRPLGHPLP
jgi:vitamin K-dependent gamma-carboxylase